MKKKLLSLMVIMSLVVSMTLGVTGCGSKSSDSDKKVLKDIFGKLLRILQIFESVDFSVFGGG